MLSRDDGKRIDRHGQCTLHDYRFHCLNAGEPYYERNVLAYHDGRLVTLCGYPLQDEPLAENSVIQDLALVWVRDRGAESVVYLGPQVVDLRQLRRYGLRVVSRQRRSQESGEILIDCTDGPQSVFGRRAYRRAKCLPFTAKLRKPGIVPADYFRLIERFYGERDMTAYLAELAFTIPAVLRMPRMDIVEARQQERLAGFVVMHRAFTDSLVAMFLAVDPDIAGVSDFLYSAMGDHARKLGAVGVNVGPSPSLGHFNFKRKWGGEPRIPPYMFVQWAKGPLANRHHVSWGPRILGLQAPRGSGR